MKCSPIILESANDAGRHLDRIESQAKDEKTEEWLQNLLFVRPDLLPVFVFDEPFAPLIPIGREVATPSGNIDILYVSPFGRLTIVETKLWKNPERHRTVVAQLIDYAKEVSEWSYDELNKAFLRASRNANDAEKRSLDQIAQPHLKNAGLTLTDFQEGVIANLSRGEFLLLIVGDRVSANVALLSEAIHGTPGLDFRLGLIELHLYPLDQESDWPLLVVPDIVGRTIEKTRGVIKVQYKQEKPEVAVEISKEEKEPKGRTTPEEFLQKTPDDLRPVFEQWLQIWQDKELFIYWGVAGFSLRVPVQGRLQTVLDAYPEWAVSLIRRSDAERCKASQEQYQQYFEKIGEVSEAPNLLAGGKKYILLKSLTPEDLMRILKSTSEFAEAVRDKDKDGKGEPL